MYILLHPRGNRRVKNGVRKTVSGTFVRGTVRRTHEPIAMPFLQLHVVLAKLLRVVPELLGDAMANRANFVDCRVGGRP